MRRVGFLARIVAALVIVSLSKLAIGTPRIAALVANEDWQAITQALKPHKNPSPVERLLLAHALLALNQNNRSVCLFLGTRSPNALLSWASWAANFAKTNDGLAIAHYLYGDSLARLGKFREAEAEFTAAIAVNSGHALSLNARAQVLAHLNEWDQAVLDARRATVIAPRFADGYSTLGTIGVLRRFNSSWALESYDRALELSPDLALAVNGRGAALVGQGLLGEATAEFTRAGRINNCLGIAGFNILQIDRIYAERAKASADLVLAASEPGTSLHTGMLELRKAADANLEKLNSAQKTAQYLKAGSQTFGDALPVIAAITPAAGKIPVVGAMKAAEIGLRGASEGAASRYDALNAEDSRRLFSSVIENSKSNAKVRENLTSRFGTASPSFEQFHAQFEVHKPGGIDMGFAHAEIDRGNWRVENWFGLLYRSLETETEKAK